MQIVESVAYISLIVFIQRMSYHQNSNCSCLLHSKVMSEVKNYQQWVENIFFLILIKRFHELCRNVLKI